jgi:ubiquinol-cytochrome c reductase cytochrome b subunit
MTWGGRFAAIAAPPIAFYVTRRICYSLQAKDRELEEHGIETGIVRQLPSGEFVEVTLPKPAPPHMELTPVELDDAPSHNGHNGGGLLTRGRRAVSGFFVDPGDEGKKAPEESAGSRH